MNLGVSRSQMTELVSDHVADVSAGLIIGLISVIVSLSEGVLIFSGALEPYVARGIAVTLLGSVVMCLTVALAGGHPLGVATAQDVTSVVLASVSASLAGVIVVDGSRGDSPRRLLATVLVAIMLAGAATGLCFFAAGRLHLGRLIRFVPHPVICGFLAGTGWQLMVGALVVLAGPVREGNVLSWLGSNSSQIVPGVVEGVLLVVLAQHVRHYLVMPLTLLAALALFYFVLAAARIPLATAQTSGWLLGPFPAGTLLQLPDPGLASQVDWTALVGQAGNFAVLIVLSGIALLLTVASMETALRQDLDLDHELKVTGVANLIAGALGGVGGFHMLAGSLLAKRAGGRTRAVGVTAAVFIAVTLLVGATLLADVPRFVLAGLVFSIGIGMLLDWGYGAWFRLSRGDFFIVVLITLGTGIAGFVPGLVLGAVAALLIFALQSSRISIIKHIASGDSMRSHVDRPLRHQQLLSAHGSEIAIIELQGFLFFGSANTLVDEIRGHMKDSENTRARYLVLDFRCVTGIDSSAAMCFAKLRYLMWQHGVTLMVTHLSAKLDRALRAGVMAEEGDDDGVTGSTQMAALVQLPDLDRGIEWCEERVLANCIGACDSPHVVSVAAMQLESTLSGSLTLSRLDPYCEQLSLARGAYLLRQGEPASEMYLVASGRVNTVLDTPSGERVRLRSAGAGTLVGEMGFYRGETRTASVVTEEPAVVYRVTLDGLERMCREDPALAIALHECVAAVLAERVAQTTAEMAALLR